VNRDSAEARQKGARGTPTVFVNGQLVSNPSFDQLKAAIEAALAKKGS
jgi:protein-disulfide isomerase